MINLNNNENNISRKDIKKQEKKNRALEKAYKEIAKNDYEIKITEINNKIKDLRSSLRIALESKNEELALLKSRNIDNLSDKKNYLERASLLESELASISNKINNIENSDEYKLLNKSLADEKEKYYTKINNFKISNFGRIISVNEKKKEVQKNDKTINSNDENINNNIGDGSDESKYVSNEELISSYNENEEIEARDDEFLNNTDVIKEEKLSRSEIRKNKRRERKIAKERKREARRSAKNEHERLNKNENIESENTYNVEKFYNESTNEGVDIIDNYDNNNIEYIRDNRSEFKKEVILEEKKNEIVNEVVNDKNEDKVSIEKLDDLLGNIDQVINNDLATDKEQIQRDELISDSIESANKKNKKTRIARENKG